MQQARSLSTSCSCSYSSSNAAYGRSQHSGSHRRPAQAASTRSRRRLVTRAATWDPENLFKGTAPQEGIIERRLMKQRIEKDKEFAAAMLTVQDEDRGKVLLRRAQREPPANDNSALIEYFLDTQTEDMDFEVARCRPLLTPEFFKELNDQVGRERFAPKPDQERLAELETLRDYLEGMSKAVDQAVVATSSAKDKVKRLLEANNKKACILEMAENNEIDQPLMDLLQQNIDMARQAEMEPQAAFMEKVKVAVSKYLVTKA